jgi:hypothetical protein
MARRSARRFIEQLLHGSELYAKRLGDRLKDRIFEEIFPHFAEGFIADLRASHNRSAASLPQEELDRVFQGTLTFLYRLLFLLYAEARDLLPVKEVRGYHEASVTKLAREVAEVAGDIHDAAPDRLRRRYAAGSSELYDRLAVLFHAVDHGDAARNVPVYNGGLFLTQVASDDISPEAENARFLLAHKIPDRHLALGLDLLARDLDDKTHALVFIDYKSLGVRQLGSIYEGLLEFRLRIAPEKMAICKGKKTDEVVPYDEARKEKRKILTAGQGKDAVERTLPKGAVYLENDKRERKATGSYYTPDYIVQYIVEHTVAPVLAESFDHARGQLREAQKALRREQEKVRAGRKKLGKADDPEREAFLKHRAVVDALFDVKVLDPAMGSGHFLVEAVDFITDRLLDFLNGFAWNPVAHQLRETRDTILHELDEQGVTVDGAKLTDVNLLKRHVLKRCIYGVDINPMAVELAKVSLWLDSFTLGAPLSFLDHHLKCGNSLIGATVAEVNAVIRTGQMSLLSGTRFEGMKQAVAGMIHIGELSDVTAAQVRESRQEFKRATNAMAPAKRLLDVYTSQWFGNAPVTSGKGKKKSAHNPALESLRDASSERWAQDPNAKLTDQSRKVAATACDATNAKRFFHWELEYPEVFYRSRQGRFERSRDAGFDAVIGHPPWIRQETIQADKAALAVHFANVFDSVADIYVFFLARGFAALAPSRLLGMIVPNKWHRAAYGEKLRRFLAEQEQPVTLIDFGHAPVFSDADTFPCIVIARRARPVDDSNVQVCSVPRRDVADARSAVVCEPQRPQRADLSFEPVGMGSRRLRRQRVAGKDRLSAPVCRCASTPVAHRFSDSRRDSTKRFSSIGKRATDSSRKTPTASRSFRGFAGSRHPALAPAVGRRVDDRSEEQREPPMAVGERGGEGRIDLSQDVPLDVPTHEPARATAAQACRPGPILVGTALVRLLRSVRSSKNHLPGYCLSQSLRSRRGKTSRRSHVLPSPRARLSSRRHPELIRRLVLLGPERLSRKG